MYTCKLYYYCINLTSKGEGLKQTHLLYCLYMYVQCITVYHMYMYNMVTFSPTSQNISCPTYY